MAEPLLFKDSTQRAGGAMGVGAIFRYQVTSRGFGMANRYQHVDAMRAIAVLLVVVAHAGLGSVVPGGSGVTIFFAISGFIITTLLLRERARTGSFDIVGFYVRRTVKLLPPLVVALVVPTLVAMLWIHIDLTAFAGQVFFFYNWQHIGHPDVLPGTDVVWSLSIEEQFYIVVALLWVWMARSRRAIPVLGCISIALILLSTVLRFVIADPGVQSAADRIYYGSDTRADSLAWGILAALLLYRWQRDTSSVSWPQRMAGSHWLLAFAVVAFVTSLIVRDDWFRQTFRYTVQSLSTCVVVLYGFVAAGTLVHRAFDGVCRVRILQVIGLSSYSIYLVHLCLIEVVNDSPVSKPVGFVIGTGISIAAGVLVYYIVEVPARKIYERIRDRRIRRGVNSLEIGRPLVVRDDDTGVRTGNS
ncbi:acyltransferase [Gordonia alkanivorans]|uniref:acyltransferase family protein n=1 Tax=Gordonia alkanivorans TaxID=84096 RepID=UPI00244D554D|nr:acyltransferase [Gordonia alkanivorans]MDH3026964.1 acyltransferase [Gordonia alkanivorans]